MWRTINQCYDLIKAIDIDSAVSKYGLRMLAKNRQVETLQFGSKILINYKSLCAYLNIETVDNASNAAI